MVKHIFYIQTYGDYLLIYEANDGMDNEGKEYTLEFYVDELDTFNSISDNIHLFLTFFLFFFMHVVFFTPILFCSFCLFVLQNFFFLSI